MDIASGFEIEEPSALVPWGIDEVELKSILGSALRHVTTGYYTITCESFGGMNRYQGNAVDKKSGKGKVNVIIA